MSAAAGTEYAPAHTGFTRITRTALNRVLAAIAAEALSLGPRGVRAQTEDDGGRLRIRLSVTLPMPPLSELAANPSAITQHGGDLIAQVQRVRSEVTRRGTELTGSTVGRVDIVVSGASIDPVPRVDRPSPSRVR